MSEHNAATYGADTGVGMIAAERQRQQSEEGWSARHDDGHRLGEIALAAAAYAVPPDVRDDAYTSPVLRISHRLWEVLWPWSRAEWKPTPRDRVRELVKAGALIAAEIDRLQRARAKR